ncbi:MAG: sulfite exporter TauE/SafE family protein [Saprospiraceae bacterium]
MPYDLSLSNWLLAFLAAFIVGLSKSGIKGIAILVVILLALVFGGKSSTGILLPMLIAGDIFAVIYYHRHTQWHYLKKLLPWMIAGVLAGVWFGNEIPEAAFKKTMAVIVLITVAIMFWWDYRKSKNIPTHWSFAGTMGLSAGFTTMVGNLAGAFSNLYFLAMRLPKVHFIGTAAWLFFIINLFKFPFHVFVWGTITKESLYLNLTLLPAIIIGLYTGIKIVKLIPEKLFRQLILVVTAAGAVMLAVGS